MATEQVSTKHLPSDTFASQDEFSVWIRVVVFALALLVLGTWLRTHEIDLRPLHNDEGVNHYFLNQITEKGYFPYSHENYHGPSYFYMTYGLVDIFGDDEFGMRLSAILFGLLTLLIPFLIYRQSGYLLPSLIALFFTTSSSLVFYSRYAIHETFFLFSTVLSGLAIYLWLISSKKIWIYIGFLGLACLLCTKETFIISLFCLFFAALSVRQSRGVFLDFLKQGSTFTFAGMLCAGLTLFVFSAGFSWPGGIRELLLGVPQWIARNDADVGHHKPFLYYTKMFLTTEPQIFLAPLLGVGTALVGFFSISQNEDRDIRMLFSERFQFFRFVFVWALLAWLVYSLVSYKTPWLIINITAPWYILLASSIHLLFQAVQEQVKIPSLLGLSLLCVLSSIYFCYSYNFTIPYGPKNPFSYTHTSPGMVELVDDVEEYWKKKPNALVLIAVKQYWPLPYYFRSKPAGVHYVVSDNVEEYTKKYDVIIMNYLVKKDLKGWDRKYYRLSDVQESETYFRKRAG